MHANPPHMPCADGRRPQAMHSARRLAGVLALLLTACSRPGADLVLRNGTVYTVDSLHPTAEAVAVLGGSIVFVGSNDDVSRFVGTHTRVIDLGGRLVLPGFVDAHVHPVQGGLELAECNLNGILTLDSLRRAVAACATGNPAAAWVRGGGFDLPIFPGGNPSRRLLDSLIPDRPAILTSADKHSAWVNSRALAAAGITRGTADPPNGRIERDRAGDPSGTLRETAQDLVARHLPAYTRAEYDSALSRALAMAARLGITTWHEANASPEITATYHRADSLGRLTVRTLVALHVDPDRGVEQVHALDSLRRQYSSPLVHVAEAKIFADGVIEAHTGALLEPYLDRPGDRGVLNLPPSRMDSLVHALDSAGFKVHVHAIGDRAVRVSLDAFARQHALDGGAGPRHIMAHLQLVEPSDVPRFAALGVVACFQPLWAYRDSYMRDLTEPRLGRRRSAWQYPIASVARTGAIVAAGSDWPVSSMDPLRAMQVAVTRQSPDDSTDAPFFPSERVDLATIVKAYTLGGAMASDAEQFIGTVSEGKAADLVVLSDDVFTGSRYAIARAHVVLTLMNGRETFRDAAVLPPAADAAPGGDRR